MTRGDDSAIPPGSECTLLLILRVHQEVDAQLDVTRPPRGCGVNYTHTRAKRGNVRRLEGAYAPCESPPSTPAVQRIQQCGDASSARVAKRTCFVHGHQLKMNGTNTMHAGHKQWTNKGLASQHVDNKATDVL